MLCLPDTATSRHLIEPSVTPLQIRLSPVVQVYVLVAVSLVLALLALGAAMGRRCLGLRLTRENRSAFRPRFDGVWIEAVIPSSPAADLPGSGIPLSIASLLSLTDAAGNRLVISPSDLIEESDVLDSYAAMRAFYARQGEIAALLRIGPVILELQVQGESSFHTLEPARQRPLGSLPFVFRLQIVVGKSGVWVGVWVGALRRSDWATRSLMLSGVGLMISAFAASICATRELALPAVEMKYADGGRRLFSARDLELAPEMTAILRQALESRASHERGVTEERTRIAREIHDNIGLQLMATLHSPKAMCKDLTIRETLTDLRARIAQQLVLAGVTMTWHATGTQAVVLPLQTAQMLRSIIREAVQNALNHANPAQIAVAARVSSGRILVSVSDGGAGFDPECVAQGKGLANLRDRAKAVGSAIQIDSNASGTRIAAEIPLGAPPRGGT